MMFDDASCFHRRCDDAGVDITYSAGCSDLAFFCLQFRRGVALKLFLDTLIKFSPKMSISLRKKLAGRGFKVFESALEVKQLKSVNHNNKRPKIS